MSKVPFHKPCIGKEEISEVTKVLESGWLTMGPKTVEFEEEFSKYMNVENAISINSCTSALHLSVRAMGVREGDEIIIPAINFASSFEVLLYERATPVVVDVDKKTGNIDVLKMEKAINKKTKGMILVHYGGCPCDMDQIIDLAKDKGLFIIEDSAHALPAYYKKRKAGTMGEIGCFSFYATKTLATGEGGMAVTDNEEYADRIRITRLHGISKDAWKRYSDKGTWHYDIKELGYKYNMTDIQAALGLVQLKKLEWMWERRKEIARRYIKAFKGLPQLYTQHIPEDRETSWHLFPILIEIESMKIGRNEFINILKERGIGTSVHFIPLYRHSYFKKFIKNSIKEYWNSEWFYEREISLPIYPTMENDEQDYVIENILDICKIWKK